MGESNKIIGEKVKSLRETKQLSIEEVAERSGISIEQIERIEENKDLPSLAPLIKIARVLGVRLGTFLDDQVELGAVITRKKDSAESDSLDVSNNSSEGKKHMAYHAMSANKSGRHMEPFLINVTAGESGETFAPSSHEGEEFIYVLSGAVEINYGKDTYLLEAGDSIYYDSIIAHHVHSACEESAMILGVVYTPY